MAGATVPPRDGRSAFVQLLEAVHAVEGLERIRFTSPHPEGLRRRPGGRLRPAAEAVCERPPARCRAAATASSSSCTAATPAERYLEIVAQAPRRAARLGVTTDLIVGFPGETEADFEQTLDLVREVGFDNAFVFKYSPRQEHPGGHDARRSCRRT